MELIICRDMLVDFREIKTMIPSISIGEDCFTLLQKLNRTNCLVFGWTMT